jgi:hypothetical protein
MRQVSESLAGRASYLTLWPMTRREQRGMGRCGVWDELLAARDEDWADVLAAQPKEPEDWRALARRGGFPTPAVHLKTAQERTVWFDGYVRTYLERDLRDLASIAALPDFRRLMRAACLRLGQLVNQTDLGRDVALPHATVYRYLNLLETSCLLVRLPAYSVNRTKRLIKAPKLYWGDAGIALHLTNGTGGRCCETLPPQHGRAGGSPAPPCHDAEGASRPPRNRMLGCTKQRAGARHQGDLESLRGRYRPRLVRAPQPRGGARRGQLLAAKRR